MLMISKFLVVLAGLFGLTMGLIAFFNPAFLGQQLGLEAASGLGQSTLRADFAAFFLIGPIACFGALLTKRYDWLWWPALLLGLTGLGRIINLIINGNSEGVLEAIAVELVLTIILVFTSRMLPSYEKRP